MVRRQKVVLVTGAGASVPYGFPDAAHLTASIAQTCRNSDSPMCVAIRKVIRDGPSLVDFGTALEGSEEFSIDAFLERDQNAEFRDIGRACIAWKMLTHERQVLTHKRDPAEDWMKILINRLREGVKDPAELRRNQVSVITFNFDYYLETRWRNALRLGLRLTGEPLERAFKTLEVVHVNGDLSTTLRSPHANLTDRAFGDEFHPLHIQQCYKDIGFFHDASGDRTMHERARSLLYNADVIAFLGFSFHPMNLARIGLPEVLETRVEGRTKSGRKAYLPEMFATGYSMYQHERDMANERALGREIGLSLIFPESTALGSAYVLRQYPILDTGDPPLDLTTSSASTVMRRASATTP